MANRYHHHSHQHPLQRDYADNGWACDGMRLPGGCKRGITGFRQTTGVPRYRCAMGCDYDLCDRCLAAAEAPSQLVNWTNTQKELFHVALDVEQCKRLNRCTYDVSGRDYAYHTDDFYHCDTCWPGQISMGCCKACLSACHSGHRVTKSEGSHTYFCDCGAGDGPRRCTIAQGTRLPGRIPTEEFLRTLQGHAPNDVNYQETTITNRTFYHGTSYEKSRSIISLGQFQASRDGQLGAGVYLTDCIGKAENFAKDAETRGKGLGAVIFQCRVTARRVKVGFSPFEVGDWSDYDAVHVDRTQESQRGELCVANPSKVTLVSWRHLYSNNWNCI